VNDMILTGDENVPALPMTDAQVAHLRRLLAWMRCEYTLDDDMLRGYVSGAQSAVAAGFATPEQASALLDAKAQQVQRCPAYVRQAVRMLTKALREHEARAGVVDGGEAGR
jgi:hypothetical protein